MLNDEVNTIKVDGNWLIYENILIGCDWSSVRDMSWIQKVLLVAKDNDLPNHMWDPSWNIFDTHASGNPLSDQFMKTTCNEEPLTLASDYPMGNDLS